MTVSQAERRSRFSTVAGGRSRSGISRRAMRPLSLAAAAEGKKGGGTSRPCPERKRSRQRGPELATPEFSQCGPALTVAEVRRSLAV